MKKVMIICLIISVTGFALNIETVPKKREDEVLIKGPVDKGGFCGLVMKFTELNDRYAMLMGIRGGITLNHAFGLGGGLYGMVNRIEVYTNYPMRNFNMDFGYGGIILELIFGSRRLVHFGTHTLIGGGSVQYRLPGYEEPWYDDFFFVLEPSVEMTINIARVFRIDAGGSYRYINGTELEGISDRSLSGAAGHITFKFGKF